VTTFCAPPTVWRMLIQEDLAAWPVKLEELIGAGEPLNPEVIERVRAAWNLTIRDGYGQTETTALVGNTPGQKLKPGSMGRPLPGFRVALLDSAGTPQQEGEICVLLQPRPACSRSARRSIAPATSRPSMTRAISPMSDAPTTCSNRRTTASARSSSKAC